mgnify:CR=1 FL=1
MMARGFTLLETLIVTVLLAFIASLAAVAVSRPDEASVLRSSEQALWQADQTARQAARTDGPVMLNVQDGAFLIWHVKTGRLLHTLTPARGEGVVLRSSSANPSIRLDSLGVSDDYTAEVQTRVGTSRFRVSGITGWVTREPAP